MPFAAALVLATLQNQIQTVPLKLIRGGITQMTAGYLSRRVPLSSNKPSGLHVPAGLSHPLYGALNLSGIRFNLVLATRSNKQLLIVDTNSNGDLQDDAPAIWRQQTGERLSSGIAEVRIPFNGHRASVSIIIVQSGPKLLTAIADYGFAGQLTLGKHVVPFVLLDSNGSGFANSSPIGSMLGFDRIGNANPITSDELYEGDQPFTINGDSFLLTSISMSAATASFTPGNKVPERPVHQFLTPGSTAPPFAATGVDGKTVNFPTDYKGHLVLVYAWSKASSPSLDWLPRVKKLYETNKGTGFDVLGICLDRAGDSAAVKLEAAQMPWVTSFDGKSWRGSAAKELNIGALPFLLLVDGTTAKVVSTMSEMMGDGLEKAVSGAVHPASE